ncbi:MAG: acyl-CoA dehydrogenase family protein [Anaerolineae bacterium]
MDFEMTPEQQLWKNTVREFSEGELEPIARKIDEEWHSIPDEIIQKMADLGVFAVTIPEEYGGMAMPGEEMQFAMITIHELARGELSMSLPVYTLLCIGWSLLVSKFGTKEAKEEILPKVASGEWFLGINTTEPGGGSDLANIKTVGVSKGDHWVVNGEKAYISGVREATERGGGHLTLFKTAPGLGYKGATFAYFPANAPGTTYSTYTDMGRMGLSTGGFIYKDVEIPKKYIMGEENKGFYVNMEGFNVARIVVSAACLGGAEKCLEISRDYTKQRILFGRPLVNFEGISFEIADDYAQLEMLKLMLHKAAWMIDQFNQGNTSITYKDINKAVAICKAHAPMLGVDIAKHGMMYHGGFGYTKDTPLEMALRGTMSYVVGAEGGYHVMKIIIARDYIGDEAVPFRGTQEGH